MICLFFLIQIQKSGIMKILSILPNKMYRFNMKRGNKLAIKLMSLFPEEGYGLIVRQLRKYSGLNVYK